MMNADEERTAAKLIRAKLLQAVEEAEVVHFDASRDARAKSIASNDADNRERGARSALNDAREKLAKSLEALK